MGLIAGCSSPASPPAPPSELPPAALRIPGSVSINVDPIRSSSGTSALAALVGPNGTFSEDITFGGDQATQENQAVDAILAPLHTFTIPATTITDHFEGDVDIGGTSFHVKMVFTDFALTGKTEACSGNTAALPICMRVWVNDQKRLAGVFTAFPTDANEGAGRLVGTNLESKDSEGVESVLVQFVYDRTDPRNLSNEIFFGLGRIGGPNDPPDFSIKAHAISTQTGPEGHAIKTLRLSASLDSGGGDVIQGQYVGRFREGADFWSGSVDIQRPTDPRSFTDACAQISTGNSVPQGDCLNLGIDVGPLGFIDFLDPTDVLLPADFPDVPPFLRVN